MYACFCFCPYAVAVEVSGLQVGRHMGLFWGPYNKDPTI